MIGGDHPIWGGVLRGLPPSERLVLVCIAAHAGADGLAWPSVARLMTATGYGGEATVRHALKNLRSRGLIHPAGRAGGSRPQYSSIRYRLTLPDQSMATPLEEEPDQSPRAARPVATSHKKNQGKNHLEEPGSARRSSQPATQAFDGMESSPPAPSTDPPGTARAILNDWWATQNPRPQQPYPAALKVITKALSDGWTETEIRQALPELPTISGAALDYWRRRRSNGKRPTGFQSADAAGAEAIARRALGLDQ